MAEERLAELADELGLGFITTSGSRATAVNDTLCKLLGRSREDLLAADSAIALFAPDARSLLASLFALGSAGPAVTQAALTLVHADGAQIPVAVSLSLSPDDAGGVDAIALVRDMRGERWRERELQLMGDLLDRLPVGVLVWDAQDASAPEDMRLAAMNIAAARVLGVEKETARGTTLAERFPGTSRDDAINLFSLAGTTRAEPFRDVAYPDADGQLRLFRWQGLGLADGKVAAVFEDVTAERAEAARRRALLERLAAIADEERRRLALDIHDDAVQRVAAAALLIEGAQRHPDPATATENLGDAAGVLRSLLDELRRLLFELSPPQLTDHGLRTALDAAADYLFAASPTSAIVRVDLQEDPPEPVRTVVYRIALEALTNVYKHASAHVVTVTISEQADRLTLTVSDDGVGVQTPAAPGHMGLRGMQERAAAIGGSCSIETRQGHGTVVHATLPRHPDRNAEPPSLPGGTGDDRERAVAEQRLQTLAEALAQARQQLFASRTQLRSTMALLDRLDTPEANPGSIAQLGAEQVGRALRAGCGVHLLSADHRWLERAGSWHADPEQRAALDASTFADQPTASGQARTVLVSREPVLVDLTSADEETRRQAASLPLALHSVIVAPLAAGAEVLGTITAVRGQLVPEPFTEDDVWFLMSIGSEIARSLRRVGVASSGVADDERRSARRR